MAFPYHVRELKRAYLREILVKWIVLKELAGF
jgi:hypothetical protein